MFFKTKRTLVVKSPKGARAKIMAKFFLLLMKIVKDTQYTPSIQNLKITPKHINFLSLKILLEITPRSLSIKCRCEEV